MSVIHRVYRLLTRRNPVLNFLNGLANSKPRNGGISKMTTRDALETHVRNRLDAYRGYAGLSPLVGLETMAEAVTTGLTVTDSVARLKRLHWSLKSLHEIFVARIAATPIYELKMAFSLHAHYCAEHVGEFAKRVREMRQPPYGLEVCPDTSLDLFFDEVLSAPDVESLVLGLYGHAVSALNRALERLIAETNKLFDHPTYRICRLTLVEMKDVQQYGREAVRCLVNPEKREALSGWSSTLERLLAAAGDLDGTREPTGETVERIFSAVPYKYDGIPRRDERFQDSYNMGVNAEALLFNPDIDPLPKSIMLY